MKFRVVVAEDDSSFLAALVSLLETEFDVVGTASTGDAAVQLASQLDPHVVVLNLEISELNGIEVTRRITNRGSPAVVVCSLEGDPEIVDAAFKAGALGYVVKARAAIDLITSVKSAAEGRRFVSPT
jgi:DNA-binding NarL/FixJ family response regulator